jgi:hypothetical protein
VWREATVACFCLLALFRSHFVALFQHQNTVTFLHPLKMADSVPLDTAVDSVYIPVARQKSIPKRVPKAILSDDVKLKLAQHINSEM